LVHDHAQTPVALGQLLARSASVQVRTCAAAREATRVAGRFDVVIAALSLPDWRGAELLAEFKARDRCGTIVLADADPPTPPARVSAGVDVWLRTPVTADVLWRAIASLAPRP
jgi:DNA-binding NarL/FixJ family response regulator